MRCPFCQAEDTRVVDSREADGGEAIRRRRECPACEGRFNTLETAQLKLPAVIKSDDSRQAFSEDKLRAGMSQALQKRPVSAEQLEQAIANILKALRASGEREVPSIRIGELVINELRRLDQVAYVRFASVYRRFEHVQAFREEIERLEGQPAPDERQMPLLND
jgi:transcriptional repressor NrdR